MASERTYFDSPPGWFAVSADGSHVIGPLSKSAAQAAVAINLDYRLAYGLRAQQKFEERAAPQS